MVHPMKKYFNTTWNLSNKREACVLCRDKTTYYGNNVIFVSHQTNANKGILRKKYELI